ncbi:glycosyltransferase family 2 protein (plasmid) [Rhodobacteraceae bacterium M382]|nr:glycosyltransferase family 2 protein [Rhodobacteraceae bacterium M382]
MFEYDITTILTGHREGRLSVATLRSIRAAVSKARAAGLSVQEIYVLDRANEITTSVFRAAAEEAGEHALLLETDLGDQGAARNHAITQARGKRTAFQDGDDLWTSDWLVQAWTFLEEVGPDVVAHPAYNYFFEGQATIFRQIDQDSDEYRPDMLRLFNYWDALAMCDTELYRRFPFPKRDMANGWAYEDWGWNCITVDAGIRHKIVPDTTIFKRRRAGSQTMNASTGKARMRRNALMSYGNPNYAGL